MRLAAGAGLISFGLGLLGWSLYATLNPVARYELRRLPSVAPTMAKEAEPLGVKPEALEQFEISALDEKSPVAEALVARDVAGRLTPLVWRNNVTEPIFFSDTSAADLGKVLTAIREHVGEDAVILAWWDLSRAIRLGAGRNAPLDDARASGLQIPGSWKNTAWQEVARWGAGVDPATTENFTPFIDALMMDETKGADALKKLAGGKVAFIAVHIADAHKLAAARPGKLSIAYKDFAAAGVSHGFIKSAQQWLRDEKIEGGYAAEPMGSATRLHYFTRKNDGETLIARLLPFSTSLPTPLTWLSLVYQHKGWWIYRLNDASPSH